MAFISCSTLLTPTSYPHPSHSYTDAVSVPSPPHTLSPWPPLAYSPTNTPTSLYPNPHPTPPNYQTNCALFASLNPPSHHSSSYFQSYPSKSQCSSSSYANISVPFSSFTVCCNSSVDAVAYFSNCLFSSPNSLFFLHDCSFCTHNCLVYVHNYW